MVKKFTFQEPFSIQGVAKYRHGGRFRTEAMMSIFHGIDDRQITAKRPSGVKKRLSRAQSLSSHRRPFCAVLGGFDLDFCGYARTARTRPMDGSFGSRGDA